MVSMNRPKIEPPITTALVVMRSEESKELIGQAVATLPRVRHAAAHGRMVIVGGSTTRYVARHLLNEDPGCATFAVGWIRDGLLGESPKDGRGPGPFLLDHGAISRGWPAPLLDKFQAGDIYIKGGNALDPMGNVGVLMGSPTGGTIGVALAILLARGGELIVPISLQKLIPSVTAACGLLGQGKVDRVMGTPVGMMPIPAGAATVVNEIEALHILFGVTATHVASGGVDDCIGSVTLHLSGTPDAMDSAWAHLDNLRQTCGS